MFDITVEELYFDLDLSAGDAVWLRQVESIPLHWQMSSQEIHKEMQ